MGKIRTVEINRDSYPISFGMAALAEFLDLAGLQLSELDKLQTTLSLTNARQLVHIGLQHGGRLGGKPYNATYLETCDLMDADEEALAKVMDLFADSLPQEGSEKKEPAPAKKRPRRSQSTH